MIRWFVAAVLLVTSTFVYAPVAHASAPSCRITVTMPIPTERGRAWFQTIDIDPTTCTARVGPLTELSSAEQHRMFEVRDG